MDQLSKCCVCDKQTACTLIKSTCSSKMLPYCRSCLASGYESYDEMVSYGFLFDQFSPSMQHKVIAPTLLFLNKTIDQFNADVLNREKV